MMKMAWHMFSTSKIRILTVLILTFVWDAADSWPAQNSDAPVFVVKYVSVESVYLEGGRDAGLAEGQKLVIRRKEIGEAELAQIEIESVTPSSAAGKILSGSGNIAPGDIACFPREELEKRNRESATKYAQVISFTQEDPLDEEVRENLPKPPSPEVNRLRGRVGFDFGYMQNGDGFASSLTGVTLRVDASRLGGSYWNLRGYYRGYRHASGGTSANPMLVDLVNRTYHLSLTYDNPNSRWVAGAGRLLVPWASSLDTLDGFYFGRRYGKETIGLFAGSAPDPTSWDYDPHRQMAGAFWNHESGSFDSFRFTSTAGLAVARIRWHPDRQFGFFQNGIFYKRYLSVYSDVQVDLLNGSQSGTPDSSTAVSTSQDVARKKLSLTRSYLTVRLQPSKALSLDISETYFRNLPTFDERLLGTGMLDRYLFQGISGGFRLELPYRFSVYSTVGRSNRSGDAKSSWDYLAGVSASNILRSGIRADVRYSRFDSSFGRGTYQSVMLSRELGERLQFDAQIGQQKVNSGWTGLQNRSSFVNANLNWFFGARYYLGGGITVYRGNEENYRQVFWTLGYRFDNRRQRRE